jgi:hypothetical protein
MKFKEIPPIEAAEVSIAVYELKDSPDIEHYFKATDLAEYFDFTNQTAPGTGGAQRFTARSGAFEFKSKTGFAVMAMGKKGKDYDGEAILVCRGTATPYDWLTDANYAITLGPSGTRVHSGFNRTFKDMKVALTLFLSQHSPRRVHCIGHSLGGALAQLAADWLANNGYAVELYTFGSPRVGTEDFAIHLTRQVGQGRIHRVCHSSDPVTMVPVWPYMHAPRPDGESWIGGSASPNIATHFMAKYEASVKGGKGGKTWSDLRCPTPTMALEYGVRLYTTNSLTELLTTAPLLAFSAIVRIVCKGVAITILPGLSLLDQMSMWVEKAASVEIEGDNLARNFLQALAKIVGLGLVIPQKITHETIKLLFRAFLWVKYNQAIQATAFAFSRV